ncbi:MAG: DUF3012 domain-containing protein [Thiotrichales bacterium]|nr:DUF3012 domain-containing protein [Thiotrichales bacterium]
MTNSVNMYLTVGCTLLLLLTTACAPEIGSEKWCANMKEKPKGDWTANEAADFAKHCLF